jgi:putative FmdB family regulatory protein
MSKFIFFEFRCQKCAQKFSDLVKPDVQEAPCPECGEIGKRVLSTGKGMFSDGMDTDMGTDYDRWERQNKQKVAQDKKFYKEHGADKKHHSVGS